MYTIVEKSTGKVLYAKFDKECLENEVAVTELQTEAFENPYFNFETREYYEFQA